MNDVFDLEFQYETYLKTYGFDEMELTEKQLFFLKHAMSFGVQMGTTLMTEGQVFVDKGVLPYELVYDGLNKLVNNALEVVDMLPIVSSSGKGRWAGN